MYLDFLLFYIHIAGVYLWQKDKHRILLPSFGVFFFSFNFLWLSKWGFVTFDSLSNIFDRGTKKLLLPQFVICL